MTFLLVVHVILALAMIAIILLQPSNSDGFTGGGGGNSFLSGRASANLLTRTTAILATFFMINSLVLAYLASHTAHTTGSITDTIIEKQLNNDTKEESPKLPEKPSVPLPE